jgi:signal transduction histidine kinase
LPHVEPRAVVPADATTVTTSWYRLEVPQTIASGDATAPLRLYVPRWQTVGRIAVYADGVTVFRPSGGAVWNGFNHPLWIALPAGVHAVWVRIDHVQASGAALSSAWIGRESELAWRHGAREWLQAELPYVASAAVLVIGLFGLAIWMLRRELLYGIYFAWSLLFFLRSMHYYMGAEALPIPEDWFGWITVNALSWMVVTLYAFGLALHGVRRPRAEAALVVCCAAATLVTLPPFKVFPEIALVAPLAYLVLIVSAIVVSGLALWSAWSARSRDALVLAVGNALSIPAGVHDWLMQNLRIDIEQPYLMPYTGIVLSAAFLFVVVRRHVIALGRSERAQAELEVRLRAREEELAQSYARLRESEHRRVLSDERQRLMQDMHDGLGSSLIGALKVAEHAGTAAVATLLRECIDDLKLAIDSLEPIESDLLLLLAALRYRLGNRLEQAGIRLRWDVQEVPRLPWLDADGALHVMRIVQEVLANAARHSGGTEVRLSTAHAHGSVVVAIEDDGFGFDGAPMPSARAGRGIANITRRAEAIGARASWEKREAGTRFELVLPLQRTRAVDPPSHPATAEQIVSRGLLTLETDDLATRAGTS